MGFSGAEKALGNLHFGPAETFLQQKQGIQIPFTADDVNCNGDEKYLSECTYSIKNDCEPNEAAGVKCILDPSYTRPHSRKKRGAQETASAIADLASTGSDIAGSVINYFERKRREKQKWLKERPDKVDLGSSGVELSIKPSKGYMDLGGEFQGGGMKVKIDRESSFDQYKGLKPCNLCSILKSKLKK